MKNGFTEAREAFVAAGVPWATECYKYADQPEAEARLLAEDIGRGARFAVINAEAEWEALAAQPMRQLIAELRRLQPHAELYACVDTRAGRAALPYQRVLAEHVAGWLPMVYPQAFQQPVRAAFAAALDGNTFYKPVMPAIQTYDRIGAALVAEQIAEVRRRGLAGYQAYTICHATDDEWAVVANDTQEDDEMEAIDALRQLQAAAALFLQAASYVLRGASLPDDLRAQLRYLIG